MVTSGGTWAKAKGLKDINTAGGQQCSATVRQYVTQTNTAFGINVDADT
jgi:hypothetical protein